MRILETIRTPSGVQHRVFTRDLPHGWILLGPMLWCALEDDQWDWTVGYRLGMDGPLPL